MVTRCFRHILPLMGVYPLQIERPVARSYHLERRQGLRPTCWRAPCDRLGDGPIETGTIRSGSSGIRRTVVVDPITDHAASNRVIVAFDPAGEVILAGAGRLTKVSL